MKIIRAIDYDDMSKKAAHIILQDIISQPDLVLGLATGSSPIGAYKVLVNMYRTGGVDFSQVTTVNLDEYKGLSREDKNSYYYFMKENLFSHTNIKAENTHIPDGMALDDDDECKRYNKVIKSLGGVDLQLLGLGHNGHIAFNEPEDVFAKESHLVSLTQSTINANSRLFIDPKDVPRYAFTMGVDSILKARKIVMVVSGVGKANILRKAFFGEVTPRVPASILQVHQDFTLIADEDALSKVEEELLNERC
ncbi:MAG TPA: glucosamine-6-phosphate deaminase [Clostridiales bacterium]|nr:glucosamine-6-phosphate deaminase [Clostridiales bacterium]